MPTPDGSSGAPSRREPEHHTLVFTVDAPATRADVAALCERLRAALATGDASTVVCDVAALCVVDTLALECVARLALTARRQGRHLRLRGAATPLRALLRQSGLEEIVRYDTAQPPP